MPPADDRITSAPEFNPQNPATWLKPDEPLIGADGRDWSWCYAWFKDVPGFPGYKVEWHGTVWSGRESRGKEWRRITATANPNRNNYLYVGLYDATGKRFKRTVHALVLQAFVESRPSGMEGCHYPDPDPSNNRLDNLRWDTSRENSADRDRLGRHARGSASVLAKLTDEQVGIAKTSRLAGKTWAEIAAPWNVHPYTVRRAVKGKTYREPQGVSSVASAKSPRV